MVDLWACAPLQYSYNQYYVKYGHYEKANYTTKLCLIAIN